MSKELKPLTDGIVTIVGVKAGKFDEEIRNHPRVVIWDSEQEHWSNKDLPSNTKAVFMTRFIGHVAFDRIVSEARKRQITIFNPDGTGMITKQVRELLNITKPVLEFEEEEAPVNPKSQHGKLHALIPFIDFAKSNAENGRILFLKSKEMGIESTEQSLTQMVSVRRRKQTRTAVPHSIQPKLDVSVEILDNMIKELGDMREFLIATVEENRLLKQRIERFKKVLEND